jgi:serine/threonine protein kinase/formylglycine-generating enzyme required for sulfatase activity
MASAPDDPYENTIFETSAEMNAQEPGNTGATRPLESGAGPATQKTQPVDDVVLDSAVPAPLVAGGRFGNYLLDAEVGRGGQGQVWRAENQLANREIALKFLATALSRNERAMRQMRDEASVLFDLTHEGIVRLMNIEQAGGRAFLVMEFLGGPSLQGVLKRRQEAGDSGLSPDECLWVLDQIAPALDYANEHGVTHRDLKPGNMMLTAPVDGELTDCDARVKLCDFGIAFVGNVEMAQLGKYDPIGTIPFMAPEVWKKEQPTPAADIYSLGATLYYLVRGEPPIVGRPPKLLKRVLSEIPPPLNSGDPVFDAAVARALSKNPANRQASADRLLQEASGGKMGRVAQKKVSTWRAVLITAIVVGLGAAGILGPKLAFATELAEDMNLEDGAIVGSRPIDFEYEVSDLSIEQTETGFVGFPRTFVTLFRDESSGRFVGAIPTPQTNGSLRLEIRNATNGDVIGGLTLEVDRTPPVPVTARSREQRPFEKGETVTLEFSFDEPVELFNVHAPDIALVGFDSTGGLFSIELPIPAEQQFDFEARDRAGNEHLFPVAIDVYDRDELRERYRKGCPLPVAEAWDPWQLDELARKHVSWESEIESDGRLTQRDRRDLLKTGGTGVLSVRFQRTLAERKDVEVRFLPHSEGAYYVDEERRRVYTKYRVCELNGTVSHSRGDRVEIEEKESGLSREVTLHSSEAADFMFSLAFLPAETQKTLELRATAGGASLYEVVLDQADPEIRVESDYETTLADYSLTIAVHDDNLRSLRVGTRNVEPEQDNVYEISGLLLSEGINDIDLIARDWAGNMARQTLNVTLDSTPPTQPELMPEADRRLVGGQPFSVALSYGERVAGRATFDFMASGTKAWFDVHDVPLDGDQLLASIATIPDRSGRLRILVEVRDAVGNERRTERTWAVDYDPWGAVPSSIRESAQIDLAPPWVAGLGESEWGDGYVLDGARRYPKCIRHLETEVEFLYVPSGSFELGSRESDDANVRLAPHVTMSGFYIARTEVSASQFLRGQGLDAADVPFDESGVLPVEVHFFEAYRWCNQLLLELPTEAQWEYAASGPENRVYPWGRSFVAENVHSQWSEQKVAVRAGIKRELTAVDTYEHGRSWCGALHMSGNLYEYCRDRLDFTAVEHGQIDPIGTVYGSRYEEHIARGGSRSTPDEGKLTTYFRFPKKDTFQPTIGFRPVWELK